MSSAGSGLTRRRFMVVTALGATAPLLADLPGLVPEAAAAMKTKVVENQNSHHANPKCKGCQVCTIFFSNCLAVNNRVCWREPALSRRSVGRM